MTINLAPAPPLIETPEVPVEVRPLEPTTPRKPSEAIRLGILVTPFQSFGYPGSERLGEGCVIATASRGGHSLADLWPEDKPPCPACDGPVGFVHLNDDHRWSRERIASWLESMGL